MVEQPNAPAATAWRVSAHVTALYPGTCSLSSPQYFGQRRPQAVGRDSTIKTLASFHPSNHRGGNWNQNGFCDQAFPAASNHNPKPSRSAAVLHLLCLPKALLSFKGTESRTKTPSALGRAAQAAQNIKPSHQAGVSFPLRSAIHTAGGQIDDSDYPSILSIDTLL